MAALVVIEGPNRGAIHTLLPETNRLGRDVSSEVTILDERASRFHAEISIEGATCRLRDLGSRNGTYLNGVRCQEADLQPGDEVRIGAVTYLYVGERDAGSGPVGITTLHIDAAPQGAPAPRHLAVGERPTAFLGQSPEILDLQRQVLRVAPKDVSVLIMGESGTGKELVARAIHRNSRRRRGPFLALNAATLRGDLLESELFGHEKGAFTGAVARRKGAFELACGGTLFLDEVGELPLETQASLLRVLEGHGFRRLGGGAAITPDARLLAATNRDLPAAMGAGEFREDLYYRLNTVQLTLPPLRERAGDARLLAGELLTAYAARSGSPARRFDAEALAALEAYPFPGNVRELKNLVERAAIFAEQEELGLDALPSALRGASADSGAAPSPTEGDRLPSLRDLEREHIARVLVHTGWNKSQAARLLGIDRVTLYKRIARYGLES